MLKQILVCTLFALVLTQHSCVSKNKGAKIKIGFSQCVGSDQWRQSMLEGMKRELSFFPDVTLLYKDANNSTEKQIDQINDLLKEGIDLLIVSPNEAKPLTPIVENIFNKGIPVIVIDRKTASSLYTAYIGGDNYEIGKRVGQYSANLLHGKGNIIEVLGLSGSSPAIEREKGFYDALQPYPQIKMIAQVHGNWLKDKAREELNALPASVLEQASLVFGQNDMMALGAYEAWKKKDLPGNVHFVGVDALPGTGLQLVNDKILTASALYPTGGEEAIKTAMAILHHEDFKKENFLKTVLIDSTNVELMKLQGDKINNQQADIEHQQSMIDEQRKIYSNQSTVLLIVLSSLVGAVFLGAITFYYLRENKKINRRLKLQNEEIRNQQQQLIEMSEKAEAAHDAKLKFFTNISHEFRTPLTLILAPLEDLFENPKLNIAVKKHLNLVHKNVIRLLRLVNQLMDFRKIETSKLKLRATENNLVDFISEITDAFKEIANKRNIDFRLITTENNLVVWFDVNMLDKVIFNLLSNAFKFTNDNGYIHIYISKSQQDNYAVIKIEDNGIGMTKESVDHAFELFFQGEYENYKGSGLGLALSKELIQLHKGTIGLSSEKWKGTSFEVKLLLGKAHLEEYETSQTEATSRIMYNDEKIYIADLLPERFHEEEAAPLERSKEHTLLLIEDNDDLRNYLTGRLRSSYEIIEADNGTAALQQAFDFIPDLIICDVVIPGKDGIALTTIFKSDMRTSHIPIILLTAKTGVEEQIEGMKNKADCYLTKPFNGKFLEETIRSLLANRYILKEHFTGEISSGLKTQTINKIDKKFINEFTAVVESNIANENFEVDDICKAIGISRVQLYRKIKALLGMNVNEYILQTRVQKAKYFLQHEDFSISEVAYKVGFSSPAYFSTVFKSKCGMTPKDFKEK
jgi:signal transduction histidine kinase/DNA-binding response OmpR family regulator